MKTHLYNFHTKFIRLNQQCSMCGKFIFSLLRRIYSELFESCYNANERGKIMDTCYRINIRNSLFRRQIRPTIIFRKAPSWGAFQCRYFLHLIWFSSIKSRVESEIIQVENFVRKFNIVSFKDSLWIGNKFVGRQFWADIV